MARLTPDTHGELGWKRAQGFAFARPIGLTPIAAAEIPQVAQSMPVAFQKVGSEWHAVAVMGPVPGTNLQMRVDGSWRGDFVPGALRVYPFWLGSGADALELWEDYLPETLSALGAAPFFENGRLTPILSQTLAFLQALRAGMRSVHAPLSWFETHHITANDVEGITVITIEGDIQADDDDAFSKAIAGKNKVIVNLHSQGGQTFVAINIGKMIRARGFATIVAEGSVCLSACAMIWLGGEMRFLHSSALLGFHASYRENRGVKQESGAGNALVGAYYNSLGLSDKAILFLTLAPPDDMLVVDAEIASTLGIAIEPLEGDTPKRSSSELVMLQRIDLYGFDYRRIDNTSLDSCRSSCEGEGRCMAFTFNKRHSVCFLKSDGRIGLHNGDAVSGYKQQIKAQLYLSNMEVLEGGDMPGGDYRDFKGPFAKCFVECAKDDRCQAFSWVSTNNSCWLKSRTSKLRPDKRIVSGNKVSVGRAFSD